MMGACISIFRGITRPLNRLTTTKRALRPRARCSLRNLGPTCIAIRMLTRTAGFLAPGGRVTIANWARRRFIAFL
jgi:hypothetical protein